MAYIRMDEAREMGRAAVPLQKSARVILSEQARAFDVRRVSTRLRHQEA